MMVLWLARLNLRDNFYILPALAYSVGISLYYLLYGASFDYLPVLVFLCAIPIMAVLGSSRKMGKYWISILSIMLSYEALQGVVGSLAVSRGIASLYSLDKSLWGFNLTGWVQSTFASPLVTAIATVFYSMHFPLVVATCLIVWYAKRALFGRYVTVMVLTSYAALLTFVLVPTAPPWYTGVASNLYQSFSATVLPQGLTSFLSLAEVDKFAAFPSLHGAYAIIFSYFMIKIDRRLALISIPITVGILFSTIYLGQHYLIDLIGGAAYALIPCLIAERFQIHIPGTQSSRRSGQAQDGKGSS
ncbi:MAG: phosphatase PAP2 family protein [Thaumarchaeota archaeon]|nr:phosphatase PAP2 family protein [Nitrososphaerota archaeon]